MGCVLVAFAFLARFLLHRYGSIAERYPVEMPRTLAAAGYVTAAFGKDHFGWNDATNHGIDHGFQSTTL